MAKAVATRACCGVALLFSFGALCAAAPVTYIFSGTGSGSIGSATFRNAPYVITLNGDTTTIDTTWEALGEFRNAVTGTINVNGLRKATIALPIVITTGCGGGGGGVGIEKAPGTPVFPSDFYAVGGAPDAACFLQSAVSASGLTVTLRAFAGIPSNRGPITLTSSSPATYQATLCTLRPRLCRRQSNQMPRTLLRTQVE